jgi:DNA helicase-2/ATP-dependent DNA helicase PcrA
MSGAIEDVDPALMFPGPLALVAGPGSGKTTRMARRIKHLIENQGADPEGITIITFTREAARNMKERLTPPAKDGMPDVTLPLERHPSMICTMHSLGWKIIGENAERLGISQGYRVLPIHLRKVLFEDAARLCGKDGTFGQQCADQKSKIGKPANDDERKTFDAYRRILRACNAIDYDDQIILACQLLREHNDICKIWKNKATHLLVDEYQDINQSQLELIQLLSGPDASGLFVVGDDDQSIYGFRGAHPGYIRDFADHFKGGKIIAIPDCFRCQPHVIGAAHGFIETFNRDRIKKPEPKCIKPEGPLVKVHDTPSDTREAEIIASIIPEALHEGDVLVLLPKIDYAEQLKAELRKRRIAFDAPSPQDSDVTLIFSALRDWLADVSNNLAFRELLDAITEGDILGIPGPRVRKPEKIAERERTVTKISSLWDSVFRGKSLREALREASQKDELYATLNKLAEELAQAVGGSPTDFANRTFEALKPWPNSARMLEELSKSRADTHGPSDGDANLVRIMTMRNSKGLEAESVFVIGLEEGAFPSGKPSDGRFEEEARLFYVSMTRAKKKLHLFHARKRSGGTTYKPESFAMKASPFIGGLPKKHCESQYHQSAAKRIDKK